MIVLYYRIKDGMDGTGIYIYIYKYIYIYIIILYTCI